MRAGTPYPGSSPQPAPAFLTGPAWRTALAALGEQAAIDTRNPAAVIELLTRAAECAEHDGDRALAESGWFRILRLGRTHDESSGVRAALTGLILLYRRWGRSQCATDAASDLIGAGDHAPVPRPGLNDRRLCCGAPTPPEINR
ncbi:hypothetical protein [Amycolatopsis sp. CA-128772]|uniref:hypothetical protein n=1 Tax=Amycolatopsis sp. CA-128772 TaxID=2073159 RepID=UPI0011B0DCC5|nr:hypothetical protein [Amycolatopsis sp. CA-128772]